MRFPGHAAAQTFHFQKVGNWQWVLNHIGYFWSLSRTHLYLALVSVVLGLALSLPIGVLAARRPRAYPAVLAVSTFLYSLPSLAVFALLLDITGLTDNTVIVALAVYAGTILVRSVTDGLRSVPEEVRLSATAMGYRPWRRLVGVELPTALPVIVAGLRVATVASISLVTVAALIGNGGLGQLFIAGENSDFITEVLCGVVLVVFWAIVCDGAILAGGWALTPWTRKQR
ncbi:MAG TPA: ABC transporter permease [Acidimicrobiales bacterium]|jgi:osmoprotectant transport system permease protein|nr:ABC transporter permease [Acidimicrobiales bacterium]